jgi:hypothetical protein
MLSATAPFGGEVRRFFPTLIARLQRRRICKKQEAAPLSLPERAWSLSRWALSRGKESIMTTGVVEVTSGVWG